MPPLATGSVPVTPDVNGKPVQLVSVPLVGVPRIGVTSVGLVLRTLLPEPVLVVTPVPPFVTPSVPVILPAGKPVQFVSVPLDGVPNAPPLTTTAPAEPTLTARAVATLVPSPDTPVLIGSPVALVSVPLDGVPNAPPLTTTAPAEPTFTPRAVKTPVPVVAPDSAFVPL